MEKYIEIAKKIIEEGIDLVGVRSLCDDEQYKIGDDCRESYEWDFANDCSTYDIDGEEGLKAGGTCATHIPVETDNVEELAKVIAEKVEENEVYANDKQAIIAGYGVNNDSALDPGEIRLVDAYVLELI